jgi:Aspartyl protease
VRAVGPPPAGRVKVSFQSAVDCIALPDSGADDNVIPRSLVERLEEIELFIPTRILKTPVRVDLAFQGPGLTAEVHHQAQLTVELHLAAGPLRLRNFKWLIVEHDMDEVFIGRTLLQALGLDAAEHLSAVRDEYNNMDCSQIPSLTGAGKLTRLLLRDQENEPKSLPAPQVLEKSAQLDSVT